MRTLTPDRTTLAEMGFTRITGEADAYSYRSLYDITEEGARILSSALGNTITVIAKPWSSTPDATGSVLLPDEWLPLLIVYYILDKGHTAGVVASTFPGVTTEVLDFDTYQEADHWYAERLTADQFANRIRLHHNWAAMSGQPYQNGRNVHFWTGRTV